MTRLLKIAARDYLAYVRTFGFWLSIVLMPVGMTLFGMAPVLMERTSPVPAVAVVDFTGGGYQAAIAKAFAPAEFRDKPLGRMISPPGAPFADAQAAAATLRPYLATDRLLPNGERLEAIVILRPDGGAVAIDLWSRNAANGAIERAVRGAVASQLRDAALGKAGIDAAALKRIEDLSPQVTVYSAKAGGKASLRDKLPGIAGFGMGVLLWMVVVTGAGMLLNSVIEEKSSRILEVLLSSASVTEIMGGKILGVAAVTATVLAVWIGLGGTLLALRFPDVAASLASILLANGTIFYLALYFIAGYLMFATLYVTVGAFCETTREAQTLLGPMMIVLSLPMVFMSQAITHPESPLLETLSWVPIFTPFMMAARLASEPPLWQIAATAALMVATTILELWVAIPAFKSGALASGRFDVRVFFASLARRGAD